jgi:hypothetical protein
MGMLKWASPLDFQRTYKVVLNALYQRIIKQKLTIAQTNDNIKYRTRHTYRESSVYPFDSILYRTDESNKNSKKESQSPDKLDAKSIDLIRTVKLSWNKPSPKH